ncbi:MAG: hypothetical protein JWO93_1537 [Micrococcaceae bacterium]|nr:hypothetical protein [Micrococcaceae bacterium]
MTSPQDENKPQPRPGSYGEIAPGVPRYGQYAPEGYRPPEGLDPNAHLRGPAGQPLAPGYAPAPGHPAGQPGSGPDGSPAKGSGNPKPPRLVLVAFQLILLAAALEVFALAGAIYALVSPSGQNELRLALSEMGVADQGLLQPVLIIAVVFVTLAVGVYVLLAFQIRKGRNWARITGAVLAALSLLNLLQPTLPTLIQVSLGVVAIVLTFAPTATGYFKRR